MEDASLPSSRSRATKRPDKKPLFQTFLRNEFDRRCAANPKYSLRAFSGKLGISAASLSRILSGDQAMSQELKEKIGRRLGLSPSEIDSMPLPSLSKKRPLPVKHVFLSEEQFLAVSDLDHYAVLNLVSLRDFSPDLDWICWKIKRSRPHVEAICARLFEAGLLRAEGKEWRRTSASTTNIVGEMKANAYRILQKQILQNAIRALEEVPLAWRNNTALTVPVDTDLMPEVIERITRFRREMEAFLMSAGPSKNQVYNLSISFSPITEISSDN